VNWSPYGITREEVSRFRLPCGRQLRLCWNRLTAVTGSNLYWASCTTPNGIAATGLASRQVSLHKVIATRLFQFAWTTLSAPFWTPLRILMIGRGQLSRLVQPTWPSAWVRGLICDPVKA